MTTEQFDAAIRALRRRRPFLPFLIEFTSGSQQQIGHPEAIRNEILFYTMRNPNGSYVLFTAESVSLLLDLPKATQPG
jgi:hypothetical protein